MKVKPQGKAGLLGVNANETLVRVQNPTTALKVKTHIKAGQLIAGFKDGMTIQ
jgi:hypothetical protein